MQRFSQTENILMFGSCWWHCFPVLNADTNRGRGASSIFEDAENALEKRKVCYQSAHTGAR